MRVHVVNGFENVRYAKAQNRENCRGGNGDNVASRGDEEQKPYEVDSSHDAPENHLCALLGLGGREEGFEYGDVGFALYQRAEAFGSPCEFNPQAGMKRHRNFMQAQANTLLGRMRDDFTDGVYPALDQRRARCARMFSRDNGHYLHAWSEFPAHGRYSFCTVHGLNDWKAAGNADGGGGTTLPAGVSAGRGR